MCVLATECSPVKVIGAPGLGGNTAKLPQHLSGLGFQNHEYTIVRFSDIDEQGKWTQKLSHLGQLGDVQQLEKEIAQHAGAEINLIGESRGAATTINWDGLEKTSDQSGVKTIVAEAAFSCIEDLPSKKLKWLRSLPKSVKIHLVRNGIPKVQEGFPLYDTLGLHPIESIKKGTTPLLLVTSEHDPVVHAAHSKLLYEQACKAGRTNVHLLTVAGNKHTGNLCDAHVQQVVHAFWAHYGAHHDAALAEQGKALFAITKPDINKKSKSYFW